MGSIPLKQEPHDEQLENASVIQLFLARFREFIRQPEAVFWSYIFPLVMMIALGMAFRNEPMEKIHVFVEDGDSAETLQKSLEESGRFVVTRGSADVARQQLRAGKSELIISATGTGTGRRGISRSIQLVPAAYMLATARMMCFSVQRDERMWSRRGSVDHGTRQPLHRFLVPGLIGMGLMGGGVWGVGFAIVDMRIRQVLKRFLATPMKKPHFVAAMMASRMVFMIPEIIVVLIVARFFFGVVNHGSYLSVALLICWARLSLPESVCSSPAARRRWRRCPG